MPDKHTIIPIFVPHKGCPNDCIFCNQRKISGQIEDNTAENIEHTIKSHLETIEKGSQIEIGFYGGSFTGIEKDKQVLFLSTANKYLQGGKITGIRLSTRPDYINENILEYLKIYNVDIIELGVQSLDDEVLKASNRGHTAEDVFKAAKLISGSGIKLGIQTMTGLPLDTKQKDINTARKVIELKPFLVRIYPVLVIKDTYLETLMRQGLYKPQTIDEAVEICSDLLELYNQNNIKVIRIGLQPSENIAEGSDVVAGPFHPAFRQLVESRLSLKKIEEAIIEHNLSNTSSIVIQTGPKNISNIAGQNRRNIYLIKHQFNIKNVRIIGNTNYNKEITVSAE